MPCVQYLLLFLFAFSSVLANYILQSFSVSRWCLQVIIINIGSMLPLDGSKEADVGGIFSHGTPHCVVHYVRHSEFPHVTVLG